MSSDQAKAYHSVTFGNKNTWDDWKCIPSTRPLVVPPELQQEKETSDWIQGEIDKSSYLTGSMQYGKADGSMEFIMVNSEPNEDSWPVRRSQILNYLHNRRRIMILDDDPEHYYAGRFTVEFSTGKDYSRMTINYVIDIYRETIS